MRVTIDSFDDFLRFFFEGGADVFRGDDFDAEPAVVTGTRQMLRFYTELFDDPAFLPLRYDRQAIDHGFRSMTDSNVPFNVASLILDLDIPWEQRERLVRSMGVLYQSLFDRDPLFGAPHMWWDAIVNDVTSGSGKYDAEERRHAEDVIFATLRSILSLKSVKCQEAALHGMGHLQHPDTGAIIDEYLHSHPDLDPSVRQYARLSALGLIE